MKRAPLLILLLAAAVWVVLGLRMPTSSTGFDTAGFGRLPVIVNGRLQPMDSAARNSLLVLRGKQSVTGETGRRIPATDWLIELTMRPERADALRVFRIDHPELRALLELPSEGPNDFSYRNIEAGLDKIHREADRARNIDAKERTAFERAALRLQNAVIVYDRLKHSLRPESSTNLLAEIVEYELSVARGLDAWRARRDNRQFDEQDLERLRHSLKHFEDIVASDYLMLIPPANPATGLDGWSSFGSALLGALSTTNVNPAALTYAKLTTAWREEKAVEFGRALAEYRKYLAESFPGAVAKTGREYVYRQWQPFMRSMVLYGLVFVAGMVSWFGWFKHLNRAAFGLLVLAFAVHTAGIAFRMAIEGRPPVTNLYSSAVFVGWGAVALGIVLEGFQRDGIGLALSSLIGLITLIIAHNLALEGDTMEVLRAVLDSNFWLATHVITITLGYSAMFVAGFLGIIYVLRGFLTASLSEELRSRLVRLTYGTVCFALLFSFVGTVLGGIWADQSWGRFWGWDPKENGALLVVLWGAIILHARWAGVVRERGLMNLAIFGNAVTAFSWFGVNMLGVGLHAYGFMDRAMFWLVLFVATQIILIGLSLLPGRCWTSFRNSDTPTS